jgi:hypothetical protein
MYDTNPLTSASVVAWNASTAALALNNSLALPWAGVHHSNDQLPTYDRWSKATSGFETIALRTIAIMRGFQPLLNGRLLELLVASTQLAIFSKSPCSIAISSWPYLQDDMSSSPPLQLSRKVVRTRSEHSSQSAHTLHVRTRPGTIAERNLPQSWLDFADIVDRIESKQKRLNSPHVWFNDVAIMWPRTRAYFKPIFPRSCKK